MTRIDPELWILVHGVDDITEWPREHLWAATQALIEMLLEDVAPRAESKPAERQRAVLLKLLRKALQTADPRQDFNVINSLLEALWPYNDGSFGNQWWEEDHQAFIDLLRSTASSFNLPTADEDPIDFTGPGWYFAWLANQPTPDHSAAADKSKTRWERFLEFFAARFPEAP